MKKFGFIAATFAFMVMLGSAAFAQAPAGKIGWLINGEATGAQRARV